MAFRFKRNEPVAKASRRLGCERIEDALECLKDCADGAAIHCARKDIKKVRAVLRLVRSGLKKGQLRKVTKPLRKAAERLAPPRDAHVKVQTLTDLKRYFKGQLAPGALRYLRSELGDAFAQEMKRMAKEKVTKAVARDLRRVGKEFERLKIKGKGWKAIGPGVKAAYADGRRAYQLASRDSSSENFHEWRKRAKDLGYQAGLLRRVWPEQMEAVTEELEQLGEYLGDDHDLAMLRQALEQQCVGERHSRELETLNALIEQRGRELRTAALAIGARFYAEKPAAFCNRLAGYWRIWRKEKSSSRASAGFTP